MEKFYSDKIKIQMTDTKNKKGQPYYIKSVVLSLNYKLHSEKDLENDWFDIEEVEYTDNLNEAYEFDLSLSTGKRAFETLLEAKTYCFEPFTHQDNLKIFTDRIEILNIDTKNLLDIDYELHYPDRENEAYL